MANFRPMVPIAINTRAKHNRTESSTRILAGILSEYHIASMKHRSYGWNNVSMPGRSNFKLARVLCVAFVSHEMGVSVPSADRGVSDDPEELHSNWFHLAEYAQKLHAGYLPLNLTEMKMPGEDPELPIQ